jgi:hypothetical protein
MSGEMILRGLALVLFIPVIGGTAAYLIGQPLKAILRRVQPALFWFTWAVNVAILAFLLSLLLLQNLLTPV